MPTPRESVSSPFRVLRHELGVALLMASGILGWIGYNLFFSRQPEFRGGAGVILPLGFCAALFFCGLKWLKDQ